MSEADLPTPRLNPHLVGHDAAEAEILDAWQTGRMHHAWLITGKRGIGKATLAYRIARFVLAGGGDGGLFGGPSTLALPESHPVFHRIAHGAHGDLRVIERQFDEKKKKLRGEIVVGDARDVGSFLSMTSAEGGWRVVIIDAVDEMNRNAANAVLKVLEEPPKRSLLLLLAHNPARLLPTIRSRCRRLALRPLADDTVATLLRRYRPELDAEDAQGLARLGEGSVGRALELAGEGGLQHYHGLIGLLRGLPRLDVPDLHDFTDKAARSDDSFRTTSELLLWWLARTISAGGHGTAPTEVVPGENGLFRTVLAAAPLDRWVEVWEKISRLLERADAVNLDKKHVLLNAFLAIERTARAA
ncbi:DNA polymerase III subunit delta' [Novispirillum sp. DQ9]|uniref:DNA polymerase III subunit delta' n=1 Tax=Novispirillum sp. DQ9 TaxID=3398612 RepID=UPI003C7A7EFA